MNDQATFDPTTFLGATLTEANTRRPPLPAGSEWPATIGDVSIESKQGTKDPSKTYTIVSFPLKLDLTPGGQDIINAQGTAEVTLEGQIFLDITASGGIDMSAGKNGGLRRYREALNMNKPGEPFSFLAMTGRQLKAKIKHELYQGELYDRLDSVSKL